jgi:hydroxymethylglutaryl-CoA reductase
MENAVIEEPKVEEESTFEKIKRFLNVAVVVLRKQKELVAELLVELPEFSETLNSVNEKLDKLIDIIEDILGVIDNGLFNFLDKIRNFFNKDD